MLKSLDPGAQQGRLAEPGRCADQSQLAVRTSVQALRQALQMVTDGASYIDVGGESTRPGATPVSEQEELDRVLPVLEWIAQESPVALSVDTSKAAVMREAIKLGVTMINDVRALREPGALAAVAEHQQLQLCNRQLCKRHQRHRVCEHPDDTHGPTRRYHPQRMIPARGRRPTIDGAGHGRLVRLGSHLLSIRNSATEPDRPEEP